MYHRRGSSLEKGPLALLSARFQPADGMIRRRLGAVANAQRRHRLMVAAGFRNQAGAGSIVTIL
jgi:hypothetical protein